MLQKREKSRHLLPAIFIAVCVFVASFIGTAWYFGLLNPKDIKKTGLHLSPFELRTPRDKITLFFPDMDFELLVPVERETAKTIHQTLRIKLILEELLKGPYNDRQNIFSSESNLLGVFVDPLGICYLDFNQKLRPIPASGIIWESMIVQSILKTIFYNFPEITGLQILIEGIEAETLGGHLDISQPFMRSVLPDGKL